VISIKVETLFIKATVHITNISALHNYRISTNRIPDVQTTNEVFNE